MNDIDKVAEALGDLADVFFGSQLGQIRVNEALAEGGPDAVAIMRYEFLKEIYGTARDFFVGDDNGGE